ncbi:hypothetical protein [Bilifractor porci]|uniref:Uncharacterized protein n=1 Tax=Bilifractor porci TaxID=2606636 RepID=A0A7X2TMV4_9FIRM|nr:hypothetical protein [Bilifractor porci]MST81547.1 hypothetical protein [Bilifractor porci]
MSAITKKAEVFKEELKKNYIGCRTCKHRPEIDDDGDVVPPKMNEPVNYSFEDYKCPFVCDDSYYNRMPDDDFYCSYWEGEQDETD